VEQRLQDLLSQARAAQQQQDLAAAANLLDQAVELAPESALALNSRGMLALAEGSFAQAEVLFLRATAADPAEASLWLNVATARRNQGNDHGEAEALDEALAIDQRNFMALLRKAELHERRSEGPQAALAWRGVIALAQMAESQPPGLQPVLDHAERFLVDHAREMEQRIAAETTETRAGLAAADTRRFDACLDVLMGRRRIYRNECHGIEFPFLPVDEFFARDHFPWLAELEARTDAIRDELRALLMGEGAVLRPYVTQRKGTPDNKWTPLDNSLDWGAIFLWEFGRPNPAIHAACPQTVAALEAFQRADIPGRGPTAFFSLLKPRTRIPPHTGVTNIRSIVHLPLIVPQGCGFRVGGETREWHEGEAFVFDDTIEHEAWNDSDHLRAVLIFDVWNPWLTLAERDLIRGLFASGSAVLGAVGEEEFRP
jgi:aspartyl/asparaginyl beta-hydroxylase (cupin superfamily)